MSAGRGLLVARALQIFFAGLLLAFGAGKLAEMPGFYAIVDSYRSLPAAIVPLAACLLALTEPGIGLWLLSG